MGGDHCMYVFKDRAFCLNLGLSLIVGVRLEKEGLEELNSHPHKRKCKRMFQIVKYLVWLNLIDHQQLLSAIKKSGH